MKSFVVFSIIVGGCFLQLVEANEECDQQLKDMRIMAIKLKNENKLDKCVQENNIPMYNGNKEEFEEYIQKKREFKEKFRQMNDEDKAPITMCYKTIYEQLTKEMGITPDEKCKEHWRNKYEECFKGENKNKEDEEV